MDRPWFDQETDLLLLDEYIVEMDSYKRIVEDRKITDTELLEQSLTRIIHERLRRLLKERAISIVPDALRPDVHGPS
jgi:hypothetical protein